MKIRIVISLLAVVTIINSYASELSASDPKDIALYPTQNYYRNCIDLSGIWNFKVDSNNVGVEAKWYNGLKQHRQIAVPGSWNEQFTDLRDYLSYVWYETEVFIPESWQGQLLFIRVNDATYKANIWVNSIPVGMHEGCHVPFAFNINEQIRWNEKNRITIQVENLQSPSRVPTGAVEGSTFGNHPGANYDFFPYSGLNREVFIYSVPKESYIKDVTVVPGFKGTIGTMDIKIEQEGAANNCEVIVSGAGQSIITPVVFKEGIANSRIEIPNVRLWSPDDPFLYKVTVRIKNGTEIIDQYAIETGIRTITSDANKIYLNGKPLFLKGFGKHIDFPVVGRGTANPVMIKDFELMKWTGANSFRTTHYPYDKAFYDLADKQGLIVIAETPSVGLYMSGDSVELEKRQEICKQYLREVISREKNHPSVIMWCVANEPNDKAQLGMMGASSKKQKEKAYSYFKEHFDLTRELDSTRLVIYVGPMMGPTNWFDLTDVIAINRYWGWYTTPGGIETGAMVLSKELDRLHRKFNKPCMVTEFGADTYAGMHSEEPEMFTEEYQVDFIRAYLDVADSKPFVTGMHVWNFADFKTSQSIIRLGGYNLKGVFTRERKPKMAAHYLRSRWFKETELKINSSNEE